MSIFLSSDCIFLYDKESVASEITIFSKSVRMSLRISENDTIENVILDSVKVQKCKSR